MILIGWTLWKNLAWEASVQEYYREYYDNFVYKSFDAKIHELVNVGDLRYKLVLDVDGEMLTFEICSRQFIDVSDTARRVFYSMEPGDSLVKRYGEGNVYLKRKNSWVEYSPDFCQPSQLFD